MFWTEVLAATIYMVATETTHTYSEQDTDQILVEDNDGENKIVLNEITLDMITFSINENGYLIISINDSEDVLTIKNFNSELFAFEFADGIIGTVNADTAEFTQTILED